MLSLLIVKVELNPDGGLTLVLVLELSPTLLIPIELFIPEFILLVPVELKLFEFGLGDYVVGAFVVLNGFH